MNAKASQTLDAPGTLHHVIVCRIERRKIVDNQTDSENFVSRMGQIASCFQDLSTILSLSDCMVNDFAMQQQEERERALIELPNEKELLTIEELDKRKKQVAQRLVRKFTETGIGLMYQEPEYDKYTFEHEAQIDCQDKLHICKAICCKIPFALSRQDVEEGIVRWDFGRPYLIAHDSDGYCVHLDRETYKCTVHENRPVPCRGFSCKDNEKWPLWLNDAQKAINPELIEKINQSNEIYNFKE